MSEVRAWIVVEPLWWLSFCDASRPEGSQFLGAAIVSGPDIAFACMNAHALGCNPGGEVMGVQIPEGCKVAAKWHGRLLNREECAALDAELMAASEKGSPSP